MGMPARLRKVGGQVDEGGESVLCLAAVKAAAFDDQRGVGGAVVAGALVLQIAGLKVAAVV